MALHKADRDTGERVDDVCATPLSDTPLRKYRMPGHESAPRVARGLVRGELSLDGDASQNLATFYTTWEDGELATAVQRVLIRHGIGPDKAALLAERTSGGRCARWRSPEPGTRARGSGSTTDGRHPCIRPDAGKPLPHAAVAGEAPHVEKD